ncbi:hypothetical protein CBM2633_P350022 [Cupriavidus taiwanensis]|nr:hypothetical protein CBM2633_P350022 [Cupriavidus taiwanensis]
MFRFDSGLKVFLHREPGLPDGDQRAVDSGGAGDVAQPV